MQIHELENYNGSLDSSAYVVVDNGSDTGKITVPNLLTDASQAINALSARVDNIIAGGDAPSAAEVTDARLGADGVTYPSLGDAIRDQVTHLQNAVDDSNQGLEILKGQFENGGIQNGSLINQPYRVRSVNPIVYDRPITLQVNDGYRVAINYY